ncbi:MAG: hypothetical protein KTV45_16400, partial [Acidimicrobiia bacterium]|nr:hypothetical protein [Acidimicrobiia bacterium]
MTVNRPKKPTDEFAGTATSSGRHGSGRGVALLVLGLVLSVSGLAGADDGRTGESLTAEPTFAFGGGG